MGRLWLNLNHLFHFFQKQRKTSYVVMVDNAANKVIFHQTWKNISFRVVFLSTWSNFNIHFLFSSSLVSTSSGSLIRIEKLFKKLLFSKLCVHKQCSKCSCSCVETLVILRAKFYFVSSFLSVLKAPALHWKIVLPENENVVNLKSALFVVIML